MDLTPLGTLTPFNRQFLASKNRFSSNSQNLMRFPSSSANMQMIQNNKLEVHICTGCIGLSLSFSLSLPLPLPLLRLTVSWAMNVFEWLNSASVRLSQEQLLITLRPGLTVEEQLLHVANDVPERKICYPIVGNFEGINFRCFHGSEWNRENLTSNFCNNTLPIIYHVQCKTNPRKLKREKLQNPTSAKIATLENFPLYSISADHW